MQVDLTSVVSIFSGVISVAFALYLAIAKYAINQREKEIDRRLDDEKAARERSSKECGDEMKKATDRLTEVEKTAIHQDGKIKVIESEKDNLLNDIDEIKRTMVTKSEWEPRMRSMEATLNQILAELRMPGRYASHPAMVPQSPFPPKKDLR